MPSQLVETCATINEPVTGRHTCVNLLAVMSLCGVLVAQPSQRIVAGLSMSPPLSAQDVAELQAKIQTDPDDLTDIARLLVWYRDFANPERRLTRLNLILLIIERHPESPVAAGSAAYVPRSNGPYANFADHELVASAWLRASSDDPERTPVLLNASRFLFREDPEKAESLLRDAVKQNPENREIAVNLGFFYGMDILGAASMRAQSAIAELERTSDPALLVGAATALPNLARTIPDAASRKPSPFELASQLMARARRLAADDREFEGPMPFIRYFEEFRRAVCD